MEEEMKCDCWENLKNKIEAEAATKNAVSTKWIFKTHLRRYLSNNGSYKKRVARDCLLIPLNYEFLILRSEQGQR